MALTIERPRAAAAPPIVPSEEWAEEAEGLRAALDSVVPPKRPGENLLIATWNIRQFGGLTAKWDAEEGDSPKRDVHALACIAEILSRFDVIAIQEVESGLQAFRHLVDHLLPQTWSFLVTDINPRPDGNNERMTYLFDTERVRASGLAGEVVLRAADGKPVEQFARAPYMVSFRAGDHAFTLLTVHIKYGKAAEDRVYELSGLAENLLHWAEAKAWGGNLLVLGDTNIDRRDDANYRAFTSTGLKPPDELNAIHRTIFGDDPKNYYDQIAWFTRGTRGPILTLRYTGRAGNFDFPEHVYTGMDRQELSRKISDHYPLWVEFSLRDEEEDR